MTYRLAREAPSRVRLHDDRRERLAALGDVEHRDEQRGPPPDPLAQLARAEEFFEVLGVAYDPRVVAVYRLRLLKRFGLEVAAIDAQEPRPTAPERLRLCAEALRRAHDQFAAWLHAPAHAARAPAACSSSCACEAGAPPAGG